MIIRFVLLVFYIRGSELLSQAYLHHDNGSFGFFALQERRNFSNEDFVWRIEVLRWHKRLLHILGSVMYSVGASN
jgi:hypothetical protein